MAGEQLSHTSMAIDGAASNKEKQLSRLQKIITGENSKAAKLKNNRPATSEEKVQSKRKRRNSVNLVLMLQVPMDVFNEIACHLDPLDLLHLARSSRGMRDLLMSKNSRSIWRTVLRALGAPECPSDINEPQFISLMFEKFCHGCGAPRVKKVDYGLRIRLCPGCFSLNVLRGEKLVATSKDYGVFRLCYFEGASIPSESVRESLSDEQYTRHKFFGPDLTEVIHQYKLLAPDSDEQTKFIQSRKELVNSICDHVKAIENWLKQFGTTTVSLAALKVQSRKASILKRLKELGYSDEDLSNPYMDGTWDSLLMQPRELTERIWQSILPDLTRIIMARREEKVERAHVSHWREIEIFYWGFCVEWKTSNGKPPIMTFQDLKQLPEVRSLVENTELTHSVSEEQWRGVDGLLPPAIHKLENRIKEDYATLITSARRSAGLPPLTAEATVDSADLVLSHASSFVLPPLSDLKITSLKTFNDVVLRRQMLALYPNNTTKAWEPISSQCPRVIKVACALIRSLGLADNVTMAEMENFGRAFVCKCCDRRPKMKRTWKQLMEHFLQEARWFEIVNNRSIRRGNTGMAIIDSHNVDTFSKLAELDLGEDTSEEIDRPGSMFKCLICRDVFLYDYTRSSRPCIVAHMRASHGEPNIEEGDLEAVYPFPWNQIDVSEL